MQVLFQFSLAFCIWESVCASLTDLSKNMFTNLNKVILIDGIRLTSAAYSEANGQLLSKTRRSAVLSPTIARYANP